MPLPDPVNARIFSRAHYRSSLNQSEIYQALEMIPGDAVLSVSSPLAPHLSARDRIYHFPHVKDAKYIALLFHEPYYPLKKESFEREAGKYRNSADYEVIYDKNDLIIFKKK